MEQHPLSGAFPPMSADDLQALTDDIEVNGQLEPIVIFDDMVLDGWHRYRGCMALGLTVNLVKLPDDEDPVAYVKSRNLHRRHLTASQRAIAVVACTEWLSRGRPVKSAPGADLATTQQMAKEADVGLRTIERAKAAHAAGHGAAVRDGKISLKKATPAKKAGKAQPNKPAIVAEFADEAFGSADLIDELDRANEELRKAHTEIESLSKGDQQTETRKWMRLVDQHQRTAREAMARAAESLEREKETMNWLRKVGQLVGEENPANIPAAVANLVKQVREAA